MKWTQVAAMVAFVIGIGVALSACNDGHRANRLGAGDVGADASDTGSAAQDADAQPSDGGGEDATQDDADRGDTRGGDARDARDAQDDTADSGTPDADAADSDVADAADSGPSCSDDSDCAAGFVCDANSVCVAADCTVDPSHRPPRCGEDPATFTGYDPATVTYEFVIQGESNSCCFDFDNDGIDDNSLGEALDSFGVLQDVNDNIAAEIAAGTYLLLWEHDGITDLSNDQFLINSWTGAYDGISHITTDGSAQNPLLIEQRSISQGTFPAHRFYSAEIVNGSFTAEQGTVPFGLNLAGAPLSSVLRDARATASVDPSLSSLSADGVFLNGGELGGLMMLEEVWDTINAAAAACPCLGLSGQNLIAYTPGDPYSASCEDTSNHTCSSGGSCETIAENCSLLTGVLPSIADIDTDGDNDHDAISVGATFEAAGADITGVEP